MNAAHILTDLTDQGLTLTLDGGRLTVSPASSLTDVTRALIHDHKAELTALLAPATNDARRLWLITRPDGSQFSLSRTPPGTLAEIQRDYPGARIEPEPDPAPGPAPSTNEEPQ